MSKPRLDPSPGAARGRCPDRPSKPQAARSARREGSTPSPLRQPLTIGTAGHVDHGKTSLVAALTGVDTDRLPEEKTRGLSIVLGYAPLELPSGRRVSIVDVPGHERFVRTMVAGATGVDAFLMTVAADDGVMPQTREHAQVLAGLGVTRGLVAITKADLADPRGARAQIAELLPGVRSLACSVRSGLGLGRLRAALEKLAGELHSRADGGGGARLHIDRVFSVRGRGTVVTGTLWSGAIAVGDAMELLPGGRQARVRAVQVHDAPLERAQAGQRVAVNLRGVSPDELARGDMLAAPGAAGERSVLICALALHQAAHGQRVQVHHGTRDVPARLSELGDGLWRLRLERPLLACRGDRLIVRSHALAGTLGGGTILDASVTPARRRGTEARPAAPPQPQAQAQAQAQASVVEEVQGALRKAGATLVSEAQLAQALEHRSPAQVAAALRALRVDGRAVRVSGRLYAHAATVQEMERRVRALIEREGMVTLAQTRDALGVGRKAAQALLEHFDAARLTRRLEDDRRVLVR